MILEIGKEVVSCLLILLIYLSAGSLAIVIDTWFIISEAPITWNSKFHVSQAVKNRSTAKEPCGRHALLSIRSFGERIKVDSRLYLRDSTATTQRCCQLKQHLETNNGRNFTKSNKRMNVCPRSSLRSNVYPVKEILDYKVSVPLKPVTSIRKGLWLPIFTLCGYSNA